jgi:hypothetical protein
MSNYVTNELGQVHAKGALVIKAKDHNMVIYASLAHRVVHVYRGKKLRGQYSHVAVNISESDAKAELKSLVDYYLSIAQREVEADLEFKAKTAKIKAETKVGDVFYSSWGSEQTNITYYQVVAIKGVTYSLREIKKERIEKGNTMTGVVVPLIGDFVNDTIINKRVTDGCFKIESYERAYPLEYTVCDITGSRIYKQKNYTAYA